MMLRRLVALTRRTLRVLSCGIGLTLVAAAFPVVASATPISSTTAPEIDPGFAASAVSLVVGSLFLLKDRCFTR